MKGRFPVFFLTRCKEGNRNLNVMLLPVSLLTHRIVRCMEMSAFISSLLSTIKYRRCGLLEVDKGPTEEVLFELWIK